MRYLHKESWGGGGWRGGISALNEQSKPDKGGSTEIDYSWGKQQIWRREQGKKSSIIEEKRGKDMYVIKEKKEGKNHDRKGGGDPFSFNGKKEEEIQGTSLRREGSTGF